MKKKYLLLVLVILLLTGCSSKRERYTVEYNLDITDIFSEKIVFALPKDAYDIADKYKDEEYASYPLEYYALKEDHYPIFSNRDEIYKRTIKKYSNGYDVTLAYNYPEKYYVYGNLVTVCFTNYDIVSADDYFEIKLSGAFTCGNQIEKLKIKVTSSHKDITSNGKKDGNSYTWTIDKDSFENVDIQYKVSRDYKKMSEIASNSVDTGKRGKVIRNLRIAVFVIMVVVIIAFSVRFYFMKKEMY